MPQVCGHLKSPEESVRFPEAEIAYSYEPPKTDAEN